MSDHNDRLVWIDCEMTGLSLEHDALVEVAALVTDSDLDVLGEGIEVVIKPPTAALEQMVDIVRGMHTTSGLLERLASGITLEDAEAQLLDYVRTHVPVARKAPHPHAAVLFYDFELSEEGQKILAARDFVPTSRKIDTPLNKLPMTFVDARVTIDEYYKWKTLYDQLFGGGR